MRFAAIVNDLRALDVPEVSWPGASLQAGNPRPVWHCSTRIQVRGDAASEFMWRCGCKSTHATLQEARPGAESPITRRGAQAWELEQGRGA